MVPVAFVMKIKFCALVYKDSDYLAHGLLNSFFFPLLDSNNMFHQYWPALALSACHVVLFFYAFALAISFIPFSSSG